MNYLLHPSGKLAYLKMGVGPEVFLIFHGFGQTHLDMMPFDLLRKSGQTFLFIDQFFHGKSQWADAEIELNRRIWQDLIRTLQEKETFQEFHLIGYSMGGKFSLLTFELFSKQVKSLTLLAPDGIKTGLWYNMNSFPKTLHPFFKRVVFQPRSFFGLVDGLNSAGLVEKSLVKFVKTQMETRSKRAQAYFVWKVFSSLQPRLGEIIRLSRLYQTPITLFTGEHDKMVTAQNLSRFSSKIPQLKKVSLPVGHGQLITAAVEYLGKG
jgi:pimeloyl-ACP methyl ester carboxylesterase